ncbi:MAG TPA: M20 family metallopeptidase [Reyranella sp.]|nr:M20 family metallopeptidase [Reyranella sp.]
MSDDLQAWCAAETAWARETVETLVRLESPSTDKPAVDRCGDEVARRLSALGGTIERLHGGSRGDHILARFAGGRRRVLLLGHIDTVWPVGQLETMPLREQEGRLFGPGIFDMKAGVSAALLALRALRTLSPAPPPSIDVLFTTDEEIGSATSRAAIEATAHGCDAVLVLEPSLPGGAAKTSRKGCAEYELTVHGRAAHAGLDPGKGASAIHELARLIVDVAALQDLDHGISVNVGRVTGGTRTNVIAGRAVAAVDVRAPTAAAAADLDRRLRALSADRPGTSLELKAGEWRPPLERTPQVVRLYELAKDVAASLGAELGEGGAGGGSDGNFTAAIGVPTLDGLGPRGDGAHALHEHIELADLTWRAAFLATLLLRLEQRD